MKNSSLKKTLIVIAVMIVLAVCLEVGDRIRQKNIADNFPSAPDSAEGFGNFVNAMAFTKPYGYILGHAIGNGSDFVPYTITSPKPNLHFVVKNIDYTNNSLGFRTSKEVVMPKPKGVFRVFVIGGSTVYGGFNDKWIMSSYLEKELSAFIPNVEVINAGVVGYASESELILLETKVLDLDPDLVVVFDGRNDIYYSTIPGWQNRGGGDYLSEKTNLDGLINYPTTKSILSYAAKFLLQRSYFLTDVFRAIFRQGVPRTYSEKVTVKDQAIATYLDNESLMKLILEKKGILGVIGFQPTMGYCKDHLTDYELSVEDYIKNTEQSDWFSVIGNLWPSIAKSFTAKLGNSDSVVSHDFTCLFKDVPETAYIDSVHYTPKGYELIAQETTKIIKESFFDRGLIKAK